MRVGLLLLLLAADFPACVFQAVGATTPAFTALLGWLLYRQTEARRVYLALVPVVGGIIITSGFEPSFHAAGLMFCVGATCARAYKSLLQVLGTRRPLAAQNLTLLDASLWHRQGQVVQLSAGSRRGSKYLVTRPWAQNPECAERRLGLPRNALCDPGALLRAREWLCRVWQGPDLKRPRCGRKQ